MMHSQKNIKLLCCMWHTLAPMDLMMVRVDRNMLSY